MSLKRLEDKNVVVVGATNLDDVLYVNDSLPQDGKIDADHQCKLLGGGGMNTAIGIALLNQVFGSSITTTLCTKIGQNAQTAEVLNDAAAFDINVVDAFADHSTQMPNNTVIAHKGGRSIIRRTNFNHASFPVSAEREQEIRSAVEHASLVFLQTKHPRIAMIAANAAQEFDIPLVVDFSNNDCPESLLENADYALLPAEFRFSDMPNDNDPMSLLGRVGGTVPYTVVSDASKPSLRMQDQNVGVIYSHNVTTRDSLGAGDLRDAAFCYFLLRDDAPDCALRKANIIASISCEYYGRDWVDELADRLKKFPEFDQNLPAQRQELALCGPT